ncbi:MAG: hypothetical protein V3V61_01275 [Gammaproteobacteria bacterium]
MSYTDYLKAPLNAVASSEEFLLFARINSQVIQLLGVIDAIPEEKHEASVGVSNYPIETGATLTDHAFIEPIELTLVCYVSDLLIDNATTLVTKFRDREAWERILLLINKRELVTVVTLLKTYNDMLITNVTTAKNENSGGGSLLFTMSFKQSLIAETQTTSLPSSQVTGIASDRTGLVNGGSKQSLEGTASQTESWLGQLLS